MPRVTRATLRSNTAALSSMGDAASSPLPPTPCNDRKPLGEIAGNTLEPSAKEDGREAKQSRGKGPAKGRKGKGAKKVEDFELADAPAKVLEDRNQSPTSPAVEGACESLINGDSEGKRCSVGMVAQN